MADEGHGGSITFGTSGTTINARSIQRTGLTREAIGTTHLGTSGGKTFQPGDTYDPGEVAVSFLWDPDTPMPYTAVAETITLTYPVPSGLTNGATEAASGFIINHDGGNMETDTEMLASITIKLSGAITQADAS